VTLRARVERELVLAREPGARTPAHVSAASGIVATARWIYVVVDDETSLGVFPRDGGAGRLRPLLDEVLPTDPGQRKAAKPDLEALCLLPAHAGTPHGALLALGSGSAERRMRGARWRLDRNGALHGAPETVDLGDLYAGLAPEVGELNIEGATVHGDALLLAQRGNGARGIDAVVRVELAAALVALSSGMAIGASLVRGIERVELPVVGGVHASFTDLAALPDGRVLYAACGEDTDDPVVDGEFTGALVGVLGEGDPREVEPSVKVEGLWVDGDRDLLLVADADDRAVPAPLLSARV
jgi:hypothetical protein